jgi:hypothetical protein
MISLARKMRTADAVKAVRNQGDRLEAYPTLFPECRVMSKKHGDRLEAYPTLFSGVSSDV